MQVLPELLAAGLPAGTVRLGVPVESVTGPTVRSAAGPVTGRAVLVATDPSTAAGLTGLPRPELRSLTTFWFVADHSPWDRPILQLDGLRRGPLANAVVLSAVAPTYSPDGRALIAASMVGPPAAGHRIGTPAAGADVCHQHARLAAAAGRRHRPGPAGDAPTARASGIRSG